MLPSSIRNFRIVSTEQFFFPLSFPFLFFFFRNSQIDERCRANLSRTFSLPTMLHHRPENKLVIEDFSLRPWIAAPVNRRAKSIGNATGKCTFPARWTEMKSKRNENPFDAYSMSDWYRRRKTKSSAIWSSERKSERNLRVFLPKFSFIAERTKKRTRDETINRMRDREYSRSRLYL